MDSNNLTPLRKGIVGVQFLFVAFGATVLVPLLVGLDPSTALFTAGIGTLIFHAVTRGKVPIFLGSSFAFIAPIIKATELYGLPGTLSGMVGVALVYFVMSARKFPARFPGSTPAGQYSSKRLRADNLWQPNPGKKHRRCVCSAYAGHLSLPAAHERKPAASSRNPHK